MTETPQTLKDLRAALDAMGLPYPKRHKKADLLAIYESATKPERSTISQSEQMAKYKTSYESYQNSNDGSISQDCGDEVAQLLRSADPTVVVRAAEIIRGFDPNTLLDRWAHLNRGSRRMNAGNMIRAGLRDPDTREYTPAALKALKSALNKAGKLS